MAIDKKAFFKKIGYEPHSQGQWAFHLSDARFRIPVCGRRYGKSTMVARDAEPVLFVPKKRGWIVGPTYDLAEKEFRVIWDDLIIDQAFGRDNRVKKAYNKKQGDMYIEFPWQTRIECRSAERPDRLVGESLDFAIMSESAKLKRETWDRYLRPALSDKRGWATFGTTPEGYNWLHNMWQFGQNPAYEDYASWCFPSWENRVIFPGGRDDPEIILLERTAASPEWFAQEIAAEFGAFVGKIYAEWDETIHLKQHVFRPDWPNYMGVDWGFTNPLAAVEFQIDPWDNVYVWREHYRAYTTLEDHIRLMKGRDQPEGYHLDLAFGDAADPEAAAYMSTHMVGCIASPEAKKNWRQGIDLVKKYLKLYEIGKKDEYGTPLEAPKLFVDHSCSNLIREFNNYKANANSTATNPREAAKAADDHALDALRYGMMHYFELGVKHHLTEVYDMSQHQHRSTSSEGLYVPSMTVEPGNSGIFLLDDRRF